MKTNLRSLERRKKHNLKIYWQDTFMKALKDLNQVQQKPSLEYFIQVRSIQTR